MESSLSSDLEAWGVQSPVEYENSVVNISSLNISFTETGTYGILYLDLNDLDSFVRYSNFVNNTIGHMIISYASYFSGSATSNLDIKFCNYFGNRDSYSLIRCDGIYVIIDNCAFQYNEILYRDTGWHSEKVRFTFEHSSSGNTTVNNCYLGDFVGSDGPVYIYNNLTETSIITFLPFECTKIFDFEESANIISHSIYHFHLFFVTAAMK